MQDSVDRLVALGQLPDEGSTDESTVAMFSEAIEALVAPASVEEGVALLDCFPATGSSFGLAWALLHFIETAPDWPPSGVLDGQSEWITLLRERADRSTP